MAKSGAGLRGKDEMRRRILNRAISYPAKIVAGMKIEGEIETTEVKRRTPVDEGTLRGTVHLEGPEIEGRKIRMGITAGGPAAPYAEIVHEDLEAHHPIGQAKYIESVIFESMPYMGERIAKRIRIDED